MLLLCGSSFQPTEAQGEPEDNPLGGLVGLIDDILRLDFEPQIMYALYEDRPGHFVQYRAAASRIDDSSAESDESSLLGSFVLGAPIHLSPEENKAGKFKFILIASGDNGALSYSPVQSWDHARLRENSKGLVALDLEVANAKTELEQLEQEQARANKRINKLMAEASSIAGVDAIVELQMQYDSLVGVEEEKDTEVERIDRLIDNARELPDPDNINTLRSNLAQNLQAAAKVTALADRLDRRSRDAAVLKFKKKLQLVEEMKTADTKALAKEVLELRKKRRELENRLGKTSRDTMNRDF